MKKIVLLLPVILLCFCFGFAASTQAQGEIPPEVLAFAENEGLPLVKEGLSKDPAGYGYTDAEQIGRITLGQGAQIAYIDPEQLKTASGSLIDITKPKEEWHFLLVADETPTSKMVIQKNEQGAYQVTEFGGNPDTLAYAINASQTAESTNATVIRERDEYIAAYKQDNKELVVPPLPLADEANRFSAPESGEAQSPERMIDVLQELQSNTADDDKDSSAGTIAARYYEENSDSPLLQPILISLALAVAATGILFWLFKRPRNNTKA